MDEIAKQLEDVFADVLKKIDRSRSITEQLQDALEKRLRHLEPNVIPLSPPTPTVPSPTGARPTVNGTVEVTIKDGDSSHVFEGVIDGNEAKVRRRDPSAKS